MYKRIFLLSLGIVYLIAVYIVFWVKVDSVEDIQRLHRYEGKILAFECVDIDKSRGARETRLNTLLSTEEYLNFRLPDKQCDDFYEKVQEPLKKQFVGHFIAAKVMQLEIGGVEIVNFDEEKRSANILALWILIFPFAVICARKYMIYRKEINKGKV
ncbi:hypothetical protein [Methylophaga sp. OBS1]|uniref:hypothetical protein n=1 Tax=Methylophaga sp. OBS1 TaxID=2991933 RepID=UPI00225BD74B|nr:hypothetical protein [Methylophaga sp. OBS1]MCX4191491.1 hypothetical protein [Methylophaga sp. OBS1]MCX4191564.1 hypothetical protein [Methylophaga sp. OBS1]